MGLDHVSETAFDAAEVRGAEEQQGQARGGPDDQSVSAEGSAQHCRAKGGDQAVRKRCHTLIEQQVGQRGSSV
jgi:hypothetical protein